MTAASPIARPRTRRALPLGTWTTAWTLVLMGSVSGGVGALRDGIVPVPTAADEAPAASDEDDDAAPAVPADDDADAPAAAQPDLADPQPFVEAIPGAVVDLEFVPVTLADGASDGEPGRVLWFARTEVTWDAFDAYVFRLDDYELDADPTVDALTRPSNPFALADRGYGHAGYPAISISHASAAAFAEWLAARTGRAYRLPTAAEWTLACEADGGLPDDRKVLDTRAWTVRNGEGSTHPVGSLAVGDAGLHDMLGNVGEWCDGPDGRPVLMGGSFQSRPDAVGCSARLEDDPAFNATDPQIPKSPWWLADGPFAGFRVVCEAPVSGDG